MSVARHRVGSLAQQKETDKSTCSKLLTVTLRVPQDLEHLSIGGVLAQGPHHVPTLAVQDLAITYSVKQLKGLLEL